jgi:hypothetical protein
MAQYPSNAPALTGAAEAIPSLPSRADLRGAAAGAAELAVLLLRGSAAAVLLSPLLLAAFFMAG